MLSDIMQKGEKDTEFLGVEGMYRRLQPLQDAQPDADLRLCTVFCIPDNESRAAAEGCLCLRMDIR